MGVDKGVRLFPDPHSGEEEKEAPLGGLEDEEAYQEEMAFYVLVTLNLKEGEEALTLVHKEVVTFYPVGEEAACQMGVGIECPWDVEGAHGNPWVFVVDRGPP